MLIIPKYRGVCDVEKVFQYYFKTLTNKVAELIRLKDLEERMDEEYIKESLILEGRVCFTRFEDFDNALYALTGNYGGEPDCYKIPSQYIISNSVLGSKTVTVRHLDGRQSTEGLDGIVVGLTHLDAELAISSTAKCIFSLPTISSARWSRSASGSAWKTITSSPPRTS